MEAITFHDGIITEDAELVFAQGEAIGYEGRIYAKLERLSKRVWIGGQAVLVERRKR